MFQSTRPRGRTRQDFGYRNSAEISFNPRVLAGGRDIGISAVRDILIVSIPVPSQSRALAISQSRNLAISQSRALAISQSRALAISQSRNLAIMDCSLQAAGERKVKTMAKICQAETAIRGLPLVCDKRKPLNARRMLMLSFISTPPPRSIETNGINSIRDFRERRMRYCRVTGFSGLFDVVKKPCGEIALTGIRHQCDNPFSCVFRSACHRQRREKSCAG